MAKYIVEVSTRIYLELEVEAEDEETAIEYAMDEADQEVFNSSLEWDVDYVERLEED